MLKALYLRVLLALAIFAVLLAAAAATGLV